MDTHTHTKEYYSAIRKKKIPSFVTMWVDLREFMLSEISQRKTNMYCMISFVYRIQKKPNLQKQRLKEWWLLGAERWEKRGDVG